MEKLQIPYPIVVEGKYDRQRLLCVADAHIVTTDGFGLFKQHEKAALIQALAKSSPLLVLTDSDGAGGLIRSRLAGILPPDRMISLYVPRIKGKESRKAAPSAEGILGVEGMALSVLYELLAPYAGGARPERGCSLTMSDLYLDGLAGGEGSAAARDRVAAHFALPPGMSAKALLAALCLVATEEDYRAAVTAARKG